MFRVTRLMEMIKERYASKLLGVSPGDFDDFFEHVKSKKPMPSDLDVYVPTYSKVKAGRVLFPRAAAVDRRTLLDILETALACCIAAKAEVPKSTNILLLRAAANCELFDGLVEELAPKIEKYRKDRAKGGEQRMVNYQPAIDYLLHLAESMRPPTGWKSIAHIARTAEPKMIEFIKAGHSTLVAGDHLRRTLRYWLRMASVVPS
jgi:hypothetical protein